MDSTEDGWRGHSRLVWISTLTLHGKVSGNVIGLFCSLCGLKTATYALQDLCLHNEVLDLIAS